MKIDDLDLQFRIGDEGDIYCDLPHETTWEKFDSEFKKIIKSINLHDGFLTNPPNACVDYVYLAHAKASDIHYEASHFIIGCVDFEDVIFKQVAEDLDINYFTVRQVEVLLKKQFVNLNSTERNILSQIRTRIRKSRSILEEIEYNKDLFAGVETK